MSTQKSPWIAVDAIEAFTKFCVQQGYPVRRHSSLIQQGHQVRKDGHWMGVVWNKHNKRFTVDRRLSLLVQSFAAERATNVGPR